MGFENGQLVRVAIAAVSSGVESVNTFHYDLKNDPGMSDNDPQSLAAQIAADVLPHFASLFPSNFQVQPVVVTDEKDPQNPNAPRGQWTAGSALAGSRAAAGDLLPYACCVVSKNRTGSIGRRYTGRTFVGGGFFEIDQAGSVWNGGVLDLVNQYLNAMPRQPDISGAGSTSTANLCVYSRTQRAAGFDPYAPHIQSMVAGDRVHWLRSRDP